MTSPTISHIESIEKIRKALAREPRKLARLKALQAWQLERLQRTYADFARQARYGDAIEFFAQQLYGAHDFSQRNRHLHKVLTLFERVLSERALHSLATALELEALSQELDLAVVAKLGTTPLTDESYAEAYRAAGRRPDREHQIELVVTAGRLLEELIQHTWIPLALTLARTPARIAGVFALHEFLETGYAAFSKMGGASNLLAVIERRETRINKNLFTGVPHPFETGVL